MKYVYAYKTSDGIRHEESMGAASRDEVFVTLRARGIRPIKVVAADGSKANGEVIVRGVRRRVVIASALLAAAVAGCAAYFLFPRSPVAGGKPSAPSPIVFTTEASRAAYMDLKAQSQRILAEHMRELGKLDLDRLSDYGLIGSAKETEAFAERIRAGYRAIDASRMATRDLFKSIFTIFPADCVAERTDAQRLYGEAMEELDRSEARLVRDEKAYRLLAANRGKWTVKGGAVSFSDNALAKEFGFLRRGLDPAETRWSRDFGK